MKVMRQIGLCFVLVLAILVSHTSLAELKRLDDDTVVFDYEDGRPPVEIAQTEYGVEPGAPTEDQQRKNIDLQLSVFPKGQENPPKQLLLLRDQKGKFDIILEHFAPQQMPPHVFNRVTIALLSDYAGDQAGAAEDEVVPEATLASHAQSFGMLHTIHFPRFASPETVLAYAEASPNLKEVRFGSVEGVTPEMVMHVIQSLNLELTPTIEVPATLADELVPAVKDFLIDVRPEDGSEDNAGAGHGGADGGSGEGGEQAATSHLASPRKVRLTIDFKAPNTAARESAPQSLIFMDDGHTIDVQIDNIYDFDSNKHDDGRLEIPLFTHVTSINFAEFPGLNDQAVASMHTNFGNLRVFHPHKNITDKTLAAFIAGREAQFAELGLKQCKDLTVGGLASVAPCENLTTLSLPKKTDDATLNQVIGMNPNISRLDIGACERLTGEGSLNELSLKSNQFSLLNLPPSTNTDSITRFLASNATSLRDFTLTKEGVMSTVLQPLQYTTNLESLSLDDLRDERVRAKFIGAPVEDGTWNDGDWTGMLAGLVNYQIPGAYTGAEFARLVDIATRQHILEGMTLIDASKLTFTDMLAIVAVPSLKQVVFKKCPLLYADEADTSPYEEILKATNAKVTFNFDRNVFGDLGQLLQGADGTNLGHLRKAKDFFRKAFEFIHAIVTLELRQAMIAELTDSLEADLLGQLPDLFEGRLGGEAQIALLDALGPALSPEQLGKVKGMVKDTILDANRAAYLEQLQAQIQEACEAIAALQDFQADWLVILNNQVDAIQPLYEAMIAMAEQEAIDAEAFDAVGTKLQEAIQPTLIAIDTMKKQLQKYDIINKIKEAAPAMHKVMLKKAIKHRADFFLDGVVLVAHDNLGLIAGIGLEDKFFPLDMILLGMAQKNQSGKVIAQRIANKVIAEAQAAAAESGGEAGASES